MDGKLWQAVVRQFHRANQPATDLVGHLRGRGFGEFERLFAVGPYPKPLVERIADPLNPMGFASSAFQADAEICWQSWHGTPPLVARARNANLTLDLP